MPGTDKGERRVQAAALAALYLRGGPGGAMAGESSRFAKAWDILRADAPCLGDVTSVLRHKGLWAETAALEQPGLLEASVALVASGRCVTPACPAYPSRWLSALGSSAPAALWASGVVPGGPLVGVAGSRVPSLAGQDWLVAVCAGLAASGCSLVSGGAAGVDRLAALSLARAGGAGRAVEVLPCGLDAHASARQVGRLSPWAPGAPFTAGQAMARNAMVYAASPCTVVVQPRFRVGGTWAGAVDALRRRLTTVIVWGPEGCAATAALVALGAVRAPACPHEAVELVTGVLARPAPAPQPSLFGASPVREGFLPYVA